MELTIVFNGLLQNSKGPLKKKSWNILNSSITYISNLGLFDYTRLDFCLKTVSMDMTYWVNTKLDFKIFQYLL